MSNPSRTTQQELISVEEHRAAVAALLGRTPAVRLPLADCLGLALAEDVHSPIPLPPFDNSAMDGYAVRAVDVAEAGEREPVELPVAEDVPAGRTDLVPLLPGTAHRIMTGAAMPPGADSVVQVEQTDAGTARVRLFSSAAPGRNVRKAGEDVAEGSTVLREGTELGAAQLGLAAAVGRGELPVHRRPRVLVLSTGSELVEPGEELLPGQIYDSNGLMLATAVREAGGEAELLRFVPDDVAEFRAALQPQLSTVDLVVTSGGVSAGAYEVVKDALADHGVRFSKVAMQPGMPQGAGRYLGVPVVTLPGNPVSSHVSFEVFVRPALRAAGGHLSLHRPVLPARLATAVRSPAGRRQYLRGDHDPATGEVRPVGGPGSHLLAALASANCLIELPEEITELAEGAAVSVLRLR